MAIERIERRPLDEERLGALRELFPEVFTDGRVDVERLRELLDGEAAEAAPGDEHYGLEWPGKRAARKQASRPATGTLRPAPGEGVDESTTKNLLIVGDNLEVLRLLQKSYAGQVKLIYIDPPYNTGNDFIYKDDFKEPVEVYLEATKQADLSGVLTSNPKSGGRFHSQWLSMMYPRLVLARQLLREDGVIFVSIDDNEVHNLRSAMDEVFGSENFVASVIWQKVYAPKSTAKHFSEDHDYALVYARHGDLWRPSMLPRTDEQNALYKNPDDDKRGPWMSDNLTARNYYSEGLYSVTCPSGRVISGPPSGRYWGISKSRFDEMNLEGRIWWGGEGNNMPRQKRFLSEVRDGRVPQTLWKYEDVGHTQESKKELLERVEFESSDSVFDTPKPTRLIQQMLRIGTTGDGGDLVLDFFAGSGTTGEAVMKLNVEDGGNRRFILVQLPEVTGHGDYKTIDRITRARLAAASKALAADSKQMELGAATGADLGFRVLDLDQSNVIRWVPYEGTDPTALPGLFQAHNGLVAGWKPENLLVEVMLLEGYPLDSALAENPAFRENRVITVSNPAIPARLLVCLDGEITDDTVETLGDFKDDIFVCCEGALTDVTKVRIADVIRNVKTL